MTAPKRPIPRLRPWEQGADVEPVSFGAWLRRQREMRDITLHEIAESSKISLRYLEALEGDRFDVLPAPVFAKGFLREYARFVGLSPDEVVNYYLVAQQGTAPPEESAPAAPQPRQVADWTYGLLLALGVAVLLGVVALLAYYGERRSASVRRPPPPIAAPPVAPAPVRPPPATTAAPQAPLRVTLDFTRDCWVEAVADDQRRISGKRMRSAVNPETQLDREDVLVKRMRASIATFFSLGAALVGTILTQVPPLWSRSESSYLRLDLPDPQDRALRHFRTSDGPFSTAAPAPSRIGLDELSASGSAQFSWEGLQQLQNKLSGRKFFDIDLRQESHGFLNGWPVSWYGTHDWANLGKGLEQIEADEQKRLAAARSSGTVIAHTRFKEGHQEMHDSFSIEVHDALTERQLIEFAGLRYHRLPIPDHRRPDDAMVDRFLDLLKRLPAGTWLHFHCEAGDGRTTTFLVLYDMWKNAKRVSLEEIVRRQWLLGGIDLFAYPAKDSWKYPYAVERAAFLRDFYGYAQARPQPSWSEWIAAKSSSKTKG